MSDSKGVKIRPATPADNSALVALAAQCAMDGDIALCVDRSPDFFALSRLEGDPWRVGVVEADDGTVVACMGVAVRQLYVGGVPTPVAYVGDLKVDPAHRRKRVGVTMALWAQETAAELIGSDGLRLTTVLAGNDAVHRAFTPVEAAGVTFTPAGTIRSHSIPLLGPRRMPRGAAVRVDRAVAGDIPEMAKLWQEVAPGRAFAPVYDEASFAAWIAAADGLSAADYLVARRSTDNAIIGFLGLWDQHSFKQMRVVRYPPSLNRFRPVFNTVAPLARVPRLPGAGGEFRYRSAVNLCVREGDTKTLRSLVIGANNWLRKGGYSFLTLGLDLDDPLSEAMSGLYSQPTDVGVFVDRIASGPPLPERGSAPLHFEIATV